MGKLKVKPYVIWNGRGEHSVNELEKLVETILGERHQYLTSKQYEEDVNYSELIQTSTDILTSLISETESVDGLQTNRLLEALERVGVNRNELEIT